VVTRNRVPRITLIKRPAGGAALHAGLWFFAGICTTMFVALLALVIAKFHPWR
jgi:hypothetical protein